MPTIGEVYNPLIEARNDVALMNYPPLNVEL